ncbi:type V toxin-antitoxin system endoribonuclease antitoxin GhoS [Yokenella regensburgei]|uniref:type V toxin-antitoxin system endoribonuclease antitoxin GhoS n=1 Tax=Yokenella regensburgei TaxID=158877 RepID=UPI003F1729BB
MSSGDISRYVVTVSFHEQSLTEINELNNQFTRAGFLLTLTDDEGKVHDLGTNTFGLISPLSEQEVQELASGLADSAVNETPEIHVTTWESWHKELQ